MPSKRIYTPQVSRRQRKEGQAYKGMVPIIEAFKPVVTILMLKDVTGWVNGDKSTGYKWHMNADQAYMVDQDKADEFIIKGYAKGKLSRKFSEDEIAQIKAGIFNISLGG